MLSIIIPTKNEEKYLPLLLRSIKKQEFGNYEIIVADAGSKDKTVELAQKQGVIVVKGGLPAKGKNEGAKVAKGDILLFLDADVILEPGFLKKSLAEFNKRKLWIASFYLAPVDKKNKLGALTFDIFYNIPITTLENSSPLGCRDFN